MPYFSIIIPTYNRAAFLAEAIEGVLSQSFSDFELVIIDDGSTDNSREIVKKYDDNRLKYFYQENSERSAARNNGINQMTGEYALFLDSDDYMTPDFLKRLKIEIEKAGNVLQLYFIRVLTRVNGSLDILFKELPEEKNILSYLMKNKSVIQVSQAVIPKCFLYYHIFEERFSLWEDTHLYFRLLAQFPYKGLQIGGVILQQHANSTVARGMSQVKLSDVNRYVKAVDDLRQNYWHLFGNQLTNKDFTNYIDAKLNMYLYQSRINHQFKEAFLIVLKILINRFNSKNLITAFKLPIHFFIFLITRKSNQNILL